VAMWINDGRSTGEGLRFVWDHGFQHGLAAGRAEQGSSQGILDDSTPEPEPVDPQTLHGIALDMVDSLRPIVIPEILTPCAGRSVSRWRSPPPSPSPTRPRRAMGGWWRGSGAFWGINSIESLPTLWPAPYSSRWPNGCAAWVIAALLPSLSGRRGDDHSPPAFPRRSGGERCSAIALSRRPCA
jgi:hypothetical protein